MKSIFYHLLDPRLGFYPGMLGGLYVIYIYIYTICFQAETLIRSKVNSRTVVEALAVSGEVLPKRSTNINVMYIRECLEAHGFGWYPKISESLF